MKKLNRKGFTLIELLAVIVIMAIILIVTVPNIIQSINEARVNSIHNLAVSVSNTYNTAFGQDLVATTNNKVLGNIPEYISGDWQCIGDLDTESNTSINKNLSEVLGISANDVVLTAATEADKMTDEKLVVNSSTGKSGITATTCSAIRLKNGSAEVVLVAANGGRFYVAQNVTYAYSKDPSAKQNAQ